MKKQPNFVKLIFKQIVTMYEKNLFAQYIIVFGLFEIYNMYIGRPEW